MNRRIHLKSRVLAPAAVLAVSLGLSTGAVADTAPFQPFYANYTVTSTYPVNAIDINETNTTYGSGTNSFSVGAGVSTITNPFKENAPLLSANLLGVATNLTSDDNDGQNHLVLFVNNTFAANAVGVAFGTLFPNTDEDTLINALEIINQTPPGGDTNLAYSEIGTFESGDAVSGPNGPISFTFGGGFSEIAFSGGQIIGTGTSYSTPATSAAPEPLTWTLMLVGVGAVGGLRRRARRAVPIAIAA